MSIYRDGELLRKEMAKRRLEGKTWSERTDLETSIDHVLQTSKHRETIRKAGFDPDDRKGLAEAKDKIVELGLYAKAKNCLAQARQIGWTLAAAGIIGGVVLGADVNTQPHYAGESPHPEDQHSYVQELEVLNPNPGYFECQGHHNDCGPNQSFPHDGYDIVMLIDVSGSMERQIDAARGSALEFSRTREQPVRFNTVDASLSSLPYGCPDLDAGVSR